MLEIFLLISAWRRGWKAKALIPIAVEIGLILLILGVSGGSGEDAQILFFLPSIMSLIWLAIMAARPPRSVPNGRIETVSSEATDTEATEVATTR